MRRQTNHLHRAHHGGLSAGADHNGRIVSEIGEQVAGVRQQFFEATVRTIEEVANLLGSQRVERAVGREAVDKESVALVGRNSPRRCVRLHQEAFLLEHGHVVTHRCRGHLNTGRVSNVG